MLLENQFYSVGSLYMLKRAIYLEDALLDCHHIDRKASCTMVQSQRQVETSLVPVVFVGLLFIILLLSMKLDMTEKTPSQSKGKLPE